MSHYNRFTMETTGDRALAAAHRLKIDLWRKDGGDVICEFELHGTLGQWTDDDDDDDDGGDVATKEPTDLSLVLELLKRLQSKGGEQ